MRKLALILLAGLISECGAIASLSPHTTTSLETLISQIPRGAKGGGFSVGKDEKALANEIQAYGAKAVPQMVKLLSSSNDQTRYFAGYVLRDLEGVGEEHLDALILARKRGDGWIPPAIARIGTPRAIDFLISDLRANPEDMTQVTWALVQAGAKSARPLALVFQGKEPPGERFQNVIRHVFSEIGQPAEVAVPILINIAQEPSLPVENRQGAVLALGAIGAPAASIIPKLKELARTFPNTFSNVVETAIEGIGSPEAAEVFAARLRRQPTKFLLRDLANIGINGRGAGPTVEKLLVGDDWDLRVTAARALGYIQDREAAGALIRALNEAADWRLVYCSAGSLGRIKATEAIPALERVAQTHWFPPVRDAAAKAIRVICDLEQYELHPNPRNFAFDFFNYQYAGAQEKFDSRQRVAKPAFAAEPHLLQKKELQRLDYEISDSRKEPSTPRKLKPDCGLRINAGYLLGADRGEWGGELVFVDSKNHAHLLLDENVEGIHEMPFGAVVTAGLAHLGINTGCLYRVEISAESSLSPTRWKMLPGAPQRSGLLANGDLFVACSGGDVIVTPSGDIRMAGR